MTHLVDRAAERARKLHEDTRADLHARTFPCSCDRDQRIQDQHLAKLAGVRERATRTAAEGKGPHVWELKLLQLFL
jgi:hypothetical protein